MSGDLTLDRAGPTYVVWCPQGPAEALPAAIDSPTFSGGHRTLHELAVAIAATGRSVEVRGRFDFAELSELGRAAGAGPARPSEPRRLTGDDVVLFLEGGPDPLTFASVLFSPARCILLLLAPPGLFGWDFTEDWVLREPADVPLDGLARPEHLSAMAAAGLEIWTHMPLVCERAAAVGAPCAFIGNGRPHPYPYRPARPRPYDVAFLAANRWADTSRRVVDALGGDVNSLEIPRAGNAQVLEMMAQARILIHPFRVEGHSRVAQEARGVGTVPATLTSNVYAVGCSEAGGGLAVGSEAAMPTAVRSLLDDPRRLEELSARAAACAAEQVRWDAYLQRVGAALERVPADPARGARARWGSRAREEIEKSRRELAAQQARADLLQQQVYALTGALAAAPASGGRGTSGWYDRVRDYARKVWWSARARRA